MATWFMASLDDAMTCPGCGGKNLHHATVTVFARGEDDPITTVTRAYPEKSVNVTIEDSETCGNPSDRRDGISIAFWCETCEEKPELTVLQHKGSTYVEWRRRE